MGTVLLVAIGSAFGATARYLVDRSFRALVDPAFPLPTFVINVTGSFALGLLAGGGESALPSPVSTALAVGVCGAYTTFSTFIWQTVRLVEGGKPLTATANLALSVAAGTGAAALGMLVWS